jgi:hypothetical protein
MSSSCAAINKCLNPRRMTMRRMILACGLLSLAISGCGSLGPDGTRPTVIEKYTGKITNYKNININGQMRVALVWFSQNVQSGKRYLVTQDIAVTPKFPAQFDLELVAAPPAEVMKDNISYDPTTPIPAGAKYAIGAMVVYQDDNANGKLDLVDDLTAQQTIDTMLGTRTDLYVYYFEGWAPKEAPKLGYNLMQTISFIASNDPMTSKREEKWFQPGEIFDLPLKVDPRLNILVCQNAGLDVMMSGSMKDMDTQKPASYPKSEDVFCVMNNTAYVLEECTTIKPGLCMGKEVQCKSETWHVPNPQPADWPCK